MHRVHIDSLLNTIKKKSENMSSVILDYKNVKTFFSMLKETLANGNSVLTKEGRIPEVV